MTESNSIEDRDEVLFAFHQECARPSSEQIRAWASRYPQFAEDIRAHAAIAWDWDAESQPVEELDESLIARGYSNALNLIYNAEHPESLATGSPATFHEMLQHSGKEAFQLAREIGIDRGVLADLFNGWMLGPVCKRLADAIRTSFGITVDGFEEALRQTLQAPRLGYAKASKTPMVTPRTCAEIIRTSNMPEDKKRYWLEEDS
jgi:hypothetical protein